MDKIDGDILVTGAAGFIGYHLCRRLLAAGAAVTGLDNLNDYYDPALKQARLDQLREFPAFSFRRLDLADREAMAALFAELRPAYVVHLAAQAGVRYSVDHPHVYIESNILGFLNILEGCRHTGVKHLVYASSSSVYGLNTKMPFAVADMTDRPVSLYGATKKANELMAHSYSHLYGIPATGLRFFTVYGPWGRPDMAYFSFTRDILAGRPIRLFNHGRMQRDFTYIDDIVEGIVRLLDHVPTRPEPALPPCRVYNIGNENPVELERFVQIIEECLGKQAVIEYLPMQAGDVVATYADIQDLTDAVGFHPATPPETGLRNFVEWYQGYYATGR
ncbi:MAG: NAD-dependent epimerase [Veillonellaceae bacterium]|nr:NAD-dependent epimerase [Veillonellaceae bacterium]